MSQPSIFEIWRVKRLEKKFKKPILRIKPDWFCLEGYYCLPNTKWFLCGFKMQHKPYGTEVILFSLPLFARKLNMHLNYFDPLDGNTRKIDVKRKKSMALAEEFIGIVEPYVNEALKRDSIENFISRIEKNESYLNTRIGYDYGLALILNGQYEKAILQLDEVSNSDWEKRVVPDEANSASELAKLLRVDTKEALNQVNKYYIANTTNLSKYLGEYDHNQS